MKIYFIDKTNKNFRIRETLEENQILLEVKKDLKFRIYKTDIVITTDFKDEYDEYQKINNLIIITEIKDRKEIFKMTEKLKTIDIIFNNSQNYDYIGKRIVKLLS